MRRLTVEIEGGNAVEQADALRTMAWRIELLPTVEGELLPAITRGPSAMRWKYWVTEMADYDREILAGAWFRSRFRSHNALARATNIADDWLALILLGEQRATVKELNAICEELGICRASLKATEETSDVDTQ